jgi:peptidoglycan/xylan/chitin deacetylase (PgdA/CDA1 family)
MIMFNDSRKCGTKTMALRHSKFSTLAWATVAGAIAFPLGVAEAQGCANNPNALGVARTVEIDTSGGPGFGFEQYKAHDFLQLKEVVLTFDDGPQKNHTEAVLAALAQHCTKATFFSIGKMALGYPEILRDVARQGHTIGTHTWSHVGVRGKNKPIDGVQEIEKGISAVKRAVGGPVAPFFRFPFLQDSKETLAHLASRNIAVFSMDVDSFDFKVKNSEQLVKSVMQKLEKKGKGILLMHDIQPGTAKALPMLLTELKAQGYKIVHMRAKSSVATLPEYDALIETSVKGLPSAGAEKSTNSVVRTVDGASESTPVPAQTQSGGLISPANAAQAGTNGKDAGGKWWNWR